MTATTTTVGTGAILLALGLTACATEPPQEFPSAGMLAPRNTAPSSAPATTYRDGDFTATGWYGSLPSHHDVTLTVANDAVVAMEITTPAEDATSLGYQQRFAAALPDAVIGRPIDELDIDRLAGSSGCSEGFMDALAQIKAAAAR